MVFRSIELLNHFQCSSCKGWWTVGDAPPDRTIWYCTWCGKAGPIGDKNPVDTNQETTTGECMKFQKLTDLEMYDLICAAYPEKFNGDGDDDIWDDVMDFVEDELGGFNATAELLGRVAMLTHPAHNTRLDKYYHALGTVTFDAGVVKMLACVKREMSQSQK